MIDLKDDSDKGEDGVFMRKRLILINHIILLPLIVLGIGLADSLLTKGSFSEAISGKKNLKEIKLPQPSYKGEISVEEAIFYRRSIREYKREPLSIREISQILWAAAGSNIDGITGATRVAPSAGACYPIETYLVVGEVKKISPGVYHYDWQEHKLTLLIPGDLRQELAKAALGQKMIQKAPASLVFAALYPRTLRRYGQRGFRYVHIDVGCMVQNVYLQSQTLGLGTVNIGAFFDEKVKEILDLKDEQPLCIMPFGKIGEK